MNTFLQPLLDSANDLYNQGIIKTLFCHLLPVIFHTSFFLYIGIQVRTPTGYATVRAALVVCSCDLPARALVTNMLQFNGTHGCLYCEDSGDTVEGKPLHRFWPHKPNSTLRTHQSLISNAKDAVTHCVTVSWLIEIRTLVMVFVYDLVDKNIVNNRMVNSLQVKGVKGASILALHSPFNLCRGVVIDSLHCLFLGVVLQLLKLWFDKAHRKKPHSIRNKVSCKRIGCNLQTYS